MVFNYKIPLFLIFIIMKSSSLHPLVEKFFTEYEKNIQSNGPQYVASQYANSIMIAMPKGVYAFKNEEFVKMLPNRKDFFDKTGLQSSNIVSVEEIDHDENYFLIKVIWNFKFKQKTHYFEVKNSATYVLRKNGDSLHIIFQLDHEDLMEKASNHNFA